MNQVKFPLTDYQKGFINNPERFTAVQAATKVGKTQPHIWWLWRFSMGKDPNHKIKGYVIKDLLNGKDEVEQIRILKEYLDGTHHWWIGPVSSQARIAFERLERKLRFLKGYKIYHSKGHEKIVTPFGSVIEFKSADKPATLYGEDVYSAVLDEFTRSKEKSYSAIYSTLTATRGVLKLIGNYIGGGNWGNILYEAKLKDPMWKCDMVNAYEAVKAGILDKDVVDQARKDLPANMFKSLYLCEGSGDELAIYNHACVLDLWTNEFVRIENDRTRYITADIAFQGKDNFVYFVWEGNVLLHIEIIPKSSGKEILMILKMACEKWHVLESDVIYDATGAGAFIDEFDNNYMAFHFSSASTEPEKYANLRSECYVKSANKVEKGHYLIGFDDHRTGLIQELTAIRRKIVTSGKWAIEEKQKIKERLGRSPDLADCFMMREIVELEGLEMEGDYDEDETMVIGF